MNCAPGDLAYIVGVNPQLGLNGRFVKLANLPAFLMFGELHWFLEESIEITLAESSLQQITGEHFPAGSVFLIMEIPDLNLRPIRHPGDDAVDEMVKLAGPSPMTLTEVCEVSHG